VISSFGKTFHTTGWKVGYCIGPAPILAEVQRVHQFMTFTVHTPSQFAFAEFVRRDPLAADLPRFYMAMRLIREHGVASIPCSAFLYKDAGGPVLRFCFAKKQETLRAAGERLRAI
jgi:methionine aminotransferase